MAKEKDMRCHRCEETTEHVKVRASEATEDSSSAMAKISGVLNDMAPPIASAMHGSFWMCRECHHYRSGSSLCIRGQGC